MKLEYSSIQEFIDDIHNDLSIKDTIMDMGLVSRDDFKGDFLNCIFHNRDNTPSLQITDKFFKCYACSAKGDLIEFIKLYYNTDFIDAVSKISKHLNINIKSIRLNFDSKYKKLKAEWDGYLSNMNAAGNDVKKFCREYFPQEVGYDKNIHYLVFPLTSKTGSILGFTKRRIDALNMDADGNIIKGRPKWKHSSLSNSAIDECHNIFNLAVASPEIRKKGEVIITEGPKDVIAYRKIDLNQSVCVCGTSNSNNIWDLLLPADSITLSMDNDEAGNKAVISIMIYLTKIYDIMKINYVELPNGLDPWDAYMESPDKLRYCYSNKISALEYFVKIASLVEVQKLLDETPEYNRVNIIKTICNVKGFSLKEAESWLEFNHKTQENSNNAMSERDQLLAIVNCEDVDVPFIPVEKAKRILALKYGIKM